jgi:Cu/Ag efflux pump CusA
MLTEGKCTNCSIKQPELITMSTDMDAKLKELQKIIPQDIITPYYEQSSFVGDAKSVTDSLLMDYF